MRMPRFRIRTLMIVVLVAATLLGGFIAYRALLATNEPKPEIVSQQVRIEPMGWAILGAIPVILIASVLVIARVLRRTSAR